MAIEYTDCPSFSASYNIMGVVTVTYSIIHGSSVLCDIDTSIRAGGQTFSGYVTNISTTRLTGTNMYETNVTLVAMTD